MRFLLSLEHRVLLNCLVRELSTNQKNCYLLRKSIKSGIVSKELTKLKCGPLKHSCWLTTAEALLFMWIKEHGLVGKILRNITLLIGYILDFYFILYIDIKVNTMKNWLKTGLQHVQRSIELFHKQPEEVQKIIKKHVSRSAYHAHSENLLAVLASMNNEDRASAVDIILSIHGNNDNGDTSLRTRKTPKLNFDSLSLQTLIS